MLYCILMCLSTLICNSLNKLIISIKYIKFYFEDVASHLGHCILGSIVRRHSRSLDNQINKKVKVKLRATSEQCLCNFSRWTLNPGQGHKKLGLSFSNRTFSPG